MASVDESSLVKHGASSLDQGRTGDTTTVFPRSPYEVVRTSPNGDLGRLAAQLVADDRVSIEPFIGDELAGLASFEEAVEITLNKADYGQLGPAQLVLE